MALILIVGSYLINLYINSNYINLTCNETSIDKCYYKPNCIIDKVLKRCENKFLEKPIIFLNKTKRTILNIIIILLFGISYVYEYVLNKPEIKNIFSYVAWLRLLSIILIIYITITNLNYVPCKYGLPTNW